MQGKTIPFHGQWQSKLELERRFIYLFFFLKQNINFKSRATDTILSQHINLGDKLLKIYKKAMSFVRSK